MYLARHNAYVVAPISDDPFAIDIAMYCRQEIDYSDVISLKTFANGEFCPRFISDEEDLNKIGHRLDNYTVIIVSTDSKSTSRNELVWQNCLLARAAKDNGAKEVVLVEPDLFFSAQDRGPRPEHGKPDFVRDEVDRKKFDGQPFSSMLYAESLKLSGVDFVITVHNHSSSVENLFNDVFDSNFMNLNPAEVFADYILTSDVVPSLHSGKGLVICAPDKGARTMAADLQRCVGENKCDLLVLAKERLGERQVSSLVDETSPCSVEEVCGKDVVVFDDMVRTGGTMKESCRLLKEAGATRVIFLVTHFHSTREVRENLNSPQIDEIITTNTLPYILNRDQQGRLRRKMTVLKLEKWIAKQILDHIELGTDHLIGHMYRADMSSKNPRSHERKTR